MKRQLSLVLALVMILGTFTSVFAADTVDPVDAIEEASKFLDSKNVLLGNEEGDLMLDETLLRQDTVVLVARLMGEEDVAKTFPTAENIPTYEDVNDPYYLPFLAWGQANKTFIGQSEKTFGFGTDITAQEYAKVLLVALGHTVGDTEDFDVKWSEALETAKTLGILENIEVANADKLVRGKMAVMTFNALGVKMKDSEETLAEKLGIEMPKPAEATELTAVVNDTKNLKEVVVELSNAKLADAEKLADKNNYRVDKFKVERVTVDGNDVILELDKALVKNRTYDLTIRGLDRAIDKKYSFKALDNASPEVVNVEVLGEYGIKVTTSEPVKDPQERDFLVDGKNVAMKLEPYGRDIILTPYYNTSFSANAETLTIKGLEDYSGYKSALKDFEIEIVNDDVAPKVVDVTYDGKVVEVTFDKDIYERSVGAYESARDEGNIFYRSGRLDIFAKEADKVDTNKVKYTFDENLPRRTDVTIVDVQNHSKVAMERTTMEAIEKKDNLEPIIVDFDVTKDVPNKEVTIEIEFDKNIDKDSISQNLEFKNNNNFNLFTEKVLTRYEAKNNEKIKTKVDYKKDDKGNDIKDTIIVKIGNLKENNDSKEFDYILEVRNFESESGNRMYTDYIEFELKEDKTLVVENIVIKEDKDEDETVVTIDFNRSVDRVRAEDGTNYLFRTAAGKKAKDAKELDGEITVTKDGKRVTIELPEFKYADYAAEGLFEITEGLRDKDGNKMADKVVYKFETDYKALKEEAEAEAAVPKDAAAAQVAYLKAGGLATDPLYVAVADALAADPQVIADIKAATTALKNETKAKLDAAADKAKVDAELDNVDDAVVLTPSTLDITTDLSSEVETAVAGSVDLNKFIIGVTKVSNNTYNVELTSKATAASKADKDINVTVVLSADQVMVNAELDNVDDAVVLTPSTLDITTDLSSEVETAIVGSVDLNKVKIVVTKVSNNTYNVELTSKATAASKADKDINVTVTP